MARKDTGDPAAEDAALDAAKRAGDAPARTILVVEDDDLDMKLFHDLLSEHGYRILQSRDGREALELARRHRPDLILMDIQLPEVSGLELANLMKRDDALKDVPIVAVTAYLSDRHETAMSEAGYAACIAKPISIASFLADIDELIG